MPQKRVKGHLVKNPKSKGKHRVRGHLRKKRVKYK